jgi:hypothetical protein
MAARGGGLARHAPLLLCLLVVGTPASGASLDAGPRNAPVVAEVAGALVCGLGAGVAGYLGTIGAVYGPPDVRLLEEHFELVELGLLVGYGAAAPAGCALGAWGVGSLLRDSRPFWPSLVGGVFGSLGGVALVVAAGNSSYTPASLAVALALPPAGAVIGYNLGPRRQEEHGWIERRLQMPQVSPAICLDEFNRPVVGFRCQLLSARF